MEEKAGVQGHSQCNEGRLIGVKDALRTVHTYGMRCCAARCCAAQRMCELPFRPSLTGWGQRLCVPFTLMAVRKPGPENDKSF